MKMYDLQEQIAHGLLGQIAKELKQGGHYTTSDFTILEVFIFQKN